MIKALDFLRRTQLMLSTLPDCYESCLHFRWKLSYAFATLRG